MENITSRQLFFIDSLGALVSAILLGLILPLYQEQIGVSASTLYRLSGGASAFFIYSSYCYWVLKRPLAPFLRVIAICNLVYCLITLGIMISLADQIKTLGVLYFGGELVIIIVLAIFELKVAKKESK